MRHASLIGVASLIAIALVAPVNSAMPSLTVADSSVPGIHMMGIYNPLDVGMPPLSGNPGAATNNLVYGGGPLETSVQLYVCYWGWTSDPSGEKPYYEAFMNNVGGSTWMSVDNQYNVNNPTGILKGTWSDATALPHRIRQSDVNNAGIRCEQHFGYSAQADYVVATPTGHSQSGFGTQWCAYHEAVNSGGNNVAITYLPYMTDAGTSCGKNFVNAGNAGLLDGVSIVGGHEMMEAQTDPVPCSGWCSGGSENADLCAWSPLSRDITLGGKSYAVQPIWSNAISGCSATG